MNVHNLIKDTTFLAWYRKTDQEAINMWEARIQASPQLRLIVEEAVMMLVMQDIGPEELPTDEKLAVERTKLMDAIQSLDQADVKLHSRRIRKFPWVAAASILVLLGIYWVFDYYTKVPLSYNSQVTELREILLPDSSIVSLNRNSSLRIEKQWTENDTIREVWLEGEAYFDVRKTKHQSKFVVHSGDLNIEVLGTSFNIKNQPTSTTVVLTTGKVHLSKEGESEKLVMQPGDLAEYSSVSGKLTHKQVNTEVFTAWKDGKIVFENASIDEIASYLTEHYNLRVNYDALSTTRNQFNGTFPIDDVSLLLDALSKAYAWEIDRMGDTLTLRQR